MDKKNDLKDIVEEINPFEADAPSAPDLHVDLDTGDVTQNANSPLKWGETDLPEVPEVEIPTWDQPAVEDVISEEPALEFTDGIAEAEERIQAAKEAAQQEGAENAQQ